MTHWRHEYHVKVDATPRIRWCRQNLGDRGDRWEFWSGGKRTVLICIRSDEDAALYDKHWRFWNVLKGNNQEESYHLSQSR
jgi:hypothetical protein